MIFLPSKECLEMSDLFWLSQQAYEGVCVCWGGACTTGL